MATPPNFLNVEAEISRAWTLPSSAYVDPAVAAIEKDKIFSRTWQVVGHSAQAAQPGDYFTTEQIGRAHV